MSTVNKGRWKGVCPEVEGPADSTPTSVATFEDDTGLILKSNAGVLIDEDQSMTFEAGDVFFDGVAAPRGLYWTDTGEFASVVYVPASTRLIVDSNADLYLAATGTLFASTGGSLSITLATNGNLTLNRGHLVVPNDKVLGWGSSTSNTRIDGNSAGAMSLRAHASVNVYKNLGAAGSSAFSIYDNASLKLQLDPNHHVLLASGSYVVQTTQLDRGLYFGSTATTDRLIHRDGGRVWLESAGAVRLNGGSDVEVYGDERCVYDAGIDGGASNRFHTFRVGGTERFRVGPSNVVVDASAKLEFKDLGTGTAYGVFAIDSGTSELVLEAASGKNLSMKAQSGKEILVAHGGGTPVRAGQQWLTFSVTKTSTQDIGATGQNVVSWGSTRQSGDGWTFSSNVYAPTRVGIAMTWVTMYAIGVTANGDGAMDIWLEESSNSGSSWSEVSGTRRPIHVLRNASGGFGANLAIVTTLNVGTTSYRYRVMSQLFVTTGVTVRLDEGTWCMKWEE